MATRASALRGLDLLYTSSSWARDAGAADQSRREAIYAVTARLADAGWAREVAQDGRDWLYIYSRGRGDERVVLLRDQDGVSLWGHAASLVDDGFAQRVLNRTGLAVHEIALSDDARADVLGGHIVAHDPVTNAYVVYTGYPRYVDDSGNEHWEPREDARLAVLAL
jgi:hypothetical protein